MNPRITLASAAALAFGVALATAAPPDPLPSWNDTAPKKALVAFVERVTKAGSPDFVPPAERIATFDNDGTLWCEQPMQVQVFFLVDRIRALAAEDPSLNERQPYKALLEHDLKTLHGLGKQAIFELAFATHAGVTDEAFDAIARQWLASARHPTLQRLFTRCLYQPQLELLALLREHDFKNYLVSGGGVGMMRAFAEDAYGIPSEQVIGSSVKTRFEMHDGRVQLMRTPELGSFDDREVKVQNIGLHIGRRPILAFGNSDGDQQMLEWTAAGDGARFMGLVHHTDAQREWAYDRQSSIGRLDKALDEANAKGWTVVDMKRDWKKIYPFE
jgi:phosphoglycolate phosphatase-like HAD superfamily hydrolase